MGKKLIDLTGKVFGRLTVLEQNGNSGGKAVWKCKCSCGKEVNVRGVHLRKGRQVSCGCKKQDREKIYEDYNARKRQLYKENPERHKAYQDKYREGNKEKIAERSKILQQKYRTQNKNIPLHKLVKDESVFWNKSVQTKSGCWEWKGSVTERGYGVYAPMPGVLVRAHRLAYAIANGKFDESLFVCHKCDNPKCINPEHLFLGTAEDNMQDMIEKGRGNHLYGEDNPISKLTEKEVIEIYFSELKNRQIANKYNIAPSLASLIRHKKVWGHLTKDLPCNVKRTTGPQRLTNTQLQASTQ